MGKTLIIKDADFSANALDVTSIGAWLFNVPKTEIEGATHNYNASNAFVFGEQEYLGMHVTKVRVKCGAVGTLTLYHSTKTNTSSAELTPLATFTLTQSDVGNMVELSADFNAPNEGYLAIKVSNIGVILSYNSSSGLTKVVPLWSPTYANSKLAGYSGNIDLYGTFPE